MADTPTGQLSGGEKARLMLGLATFAGPHLVMLDEPTNHLDIDSRSALVAGINEFPGAVILVSHDRYLIEACADRLLLVANGEVTPFDGDLDDYRKWILSSGRANSSQDDANGKERGPKRPDRAEVRRSAAEKRQELAPLRKRIAEAEATVTRLTKEIAKLDAILAEPGLFARDPAKAAASAKARSDHADALARAEEDWLEASAVGRGRHGVRQMPVADR